MAIDTILSLGQPPPTEYTDLHIHADGHEARLALFERIDQAKHSIDVCTFILRNDALGIEVLERLCHRFEEGIRIRMLHDGLGRMLTGRIHLRRFKREGGEFRLFMPPLISLRHGRSNQRDHRKMVVADAAEAGRRLCCGGRNLAIE